MYGTTREDIIKRRGYESILENVVIAPYWEHTLFSDYCSSITQVSEKVYNVKGDGFEFSFIQIKNIGASSILEEVLALGVTKAKRMIFIGSAGALNEDIKIGDLVVPSYSINGVGATRYLNEALNDDFNVKYYPSEKLTNKLVEVINKMNFSVKRAVNYSVDTIIAQFPHINHIKELGAQTIEMETSAFFKCAEMIGVEATALFVISDNTTVNKSLYSGRSEEDSFKRKKARKELVPNIVIEAFKGK
jgi:purine-nucleoside phosphorylase